jgi:hypothetical protein
MSQNFDSKIEEIVKLTDRNFIRKFVHNKDFISFKKSMENLNDSVNNLGNSELEQKSKECVEWIMERVNKWNMAIDNFHIVNKLKELLPLLKEINENLSKAEDARLAKEAEDARLAKEAEDARLAKEAEDARLAKEVKQVRLAKAKQTRLAKPKQTRSAKEVEEAKLEKEVEKEVENILSAEENKNESFAKAVLKAQKNNEDQVSDVKFNDVVAEQIL